MCRPSERQDLPKLVFNCVKFRRRQFAHLAGDHVVFDRSDDPRDDRRIQKTGLAPRLDLVVSDQQSTNIARDGSEDGLAPTLMITVGAHDETGPLLADGP